MAQKRNIFEEVGDTQPQSPVATGLIDRGRSDARPAIRVWLIVLFVLVWVMIAVGGLTRLTDSGLSITEWAPITGAMPPLTEADWQAEFDRYKQIDEWQIQNQWMTLADFKVIYWWEWGHRQLGRFLGLIWGVGFLWFLLRGKIPPGRRGLAPPVLGFLTFGLLIGATVAAEQNANDAPLALQIESAALGLMALFMVLGLMAKSMDWTARLLFIGFLGGMQGSIGWWMVNSGVTQGEGVLDVASYRLALHLGLAFVILGTIAWYVFLLGRSERDLMQARRSKDGKLFGMATGWLHFCFVQILLGALVAGIDAGRSYTDWPTMGGQILPPEPLSLEPVWRNFFENPGLVQFVHRLAGYLLLIMAIGIWVASRRSAQTGTRFAFNAAFAALCVQVVIGVVTVLYAAPLSIAIVHQAVAVLVWVLILRARFLAAYPVQQSIRR